ncbi:acetoin utilization protein AcuC, partial [Dietzia sp. SLG510A3-30A2]|nr:acetoin utilization protein AcuC [Dietzia sp. SLG510A3-30A2]
TLTAARAIASGAATRAVSVAGGMHHAMPAAAAGFCVYNDAAVAISWLLDNGYDRVAYVDIDVHHGDGVQTAFYEDPRVLTVSLHQHPATLWPSTGWASETGVGRAEGTAVNLAYLPAVTDDLWLRGFHAVVPGVLRTFEPQIIVMQAGCDSHREDPLADLSLTVDGHRQSYLEVVALADELCEGRLIAIGGGGYELVRVVPRSWTHLIAAVLGVPLDPATAIPDQWRAAAGRFTVPDRVPQTMGDGETPGYTPWEPAGSDRGVEMDRSLARLDQSILDTRRSVYPLLGLDPDDPRD